MFYKNVALWQLLGSVSMCDNLVMVPSNRKTSNIFTDYTKAKL